MTATLKSTAEEIASRCLATQARTLGRVITAIYDEHLKDVGVTASQLTILAALETAPGTQPAALCETLRLDKSTLSRTVDRLESRGWVERKGASDARSHVLHLTTAGKGVLRKAAKQWRKAQTEVKTLLGNGGVKALQQASGKL
jgi:DNA-binding MarR family transcriptional regulator